MRKLLVYLKNRLDEQSQLLLRNTSWILGSSIIRSGLAFLRSIVVARCLGLEAYGTYAIIASFVVALQDFFNLNIGNAFIKFGAEFRTQKRTDKVVALMKACFFATFITACLSLLVTWGLVSLAYEKIVDQPGLAVYILLFALSDVSTFFDPLGKSILRLYYKFRINSLIQVATSVVELAVISVVVFMNPGDIKSFIIALLCIRLVNLLINNSVVYVELRHEIGAHLGAPLRLLAGSKREIFRFAAGNSLSKSLLTVINQGDTFLVGTIAGTSFAAFYNIAKRLAGVCAAVTDPFMQSIYPQLSNLVAERKVTEIKTMILRIMKTAAVPALTVAAVVMLLSPWLVTLIYGGDFAPAAGALRITILTSMLASVFFWNQGMMLSLGLVRYRFMVYLFTLAGGIGLAFILVPPWQATGMALTVLLMKTTIISTFTLVSIKKLNQLADTT